MNTMSERHDVLIVGGGLVGASLAIALDRLGRDVGLLEASPAGELPACSGDGKCGTWGKVCAR